MLRAALLTLLLLVGLAGTALAFFNLQNVSFNYLFGTVRVPLIGLMLGELVLLSLIALLAIAARVWSLRLEIRSLRKRLAATETELKNLRSLAGASGS